MTCCFLRRQRFHDTPFCQSNQESAVRVGWLGRRRDAPDRITTLSGRWTDVSHTQKRMFPEHDPSFTAQPSHRALNPAV
jgi:hypothetical protein